MRRRPLPGVVGAAAGPLSGPGRTPRHALWSVIFCNGVGSLLVDSINFHKEIVLEYSVNFADLFGTSSEHKNQG
jgi:hypothetical protein